MPSRWSWLAVLALPLLLPAQETTADLRAILERLGRLEKENQTLIEEVRSLRREVASLRTVPTAPAAAAPGAAAPARPHEQLEERVAVQESRTAELAQSKVESGSRFPLRITGMALFNSFWTSRHGGDQQAPTTASSTTGHASAGGSLRQSLLGLEFNGPRTVLGARLSGWLMTDFFAGSGTPLNQLVRIRVASMKLDWANTSFQVGQEKPLISAREPYSLSQVGISPLTGSGNLWYWQPQARVEQRFHLGRSAGLRAQASVIQTNEASTPVPSELTASLQRSRPGYEGRFEFWAGSSDGPRLEFAPGFHASATHVGGLSIPSRVYSIDWLARPIPRLEFTGTYFAGENVTPLGALRQGFTVFSNADIRAVHTRSGWGQLAFKVTPRWTINLFSGQQDDRNSDLLDGAIGKNVLWGWNTAYQLAPNFIVALEGTNIRTTYLGSGTRQVNHYDLAFAYLF